MKPLRSLPCLSAVALVAAVFCPSRAQAQTAYGYDSAGTLYSFNVLAPGALLTVGSIGFTPEGIDFNPQNNVLFALDLGPTTSSLYTLDLSNAAATLVGTFATAGSSGATAYDFSNSTSVGFDFNPKTVQAGDGSIRIRLVSSDGDNIRLRSTDAGSGVFAAADTRLSGLLTGADAVAYNNNVAATSGATFLYYVKNGVNELAVSTNPNGGVTQDTNASATLGTTPANGTGLDVYTAADGTNTGYLVTDANTNGVSELYRIDNIGVVAVEAQFVGTTGTVALQDIAVQPVPEPASLGLLAVGTLALLGRRRSRR